MDIENLIHHPEIMDKETLYDLRSLLALYPYYQTARLLLLQNLYLLRDPSFDEELHRAAIYITDRRRIFQMIEAAHYRLKNETADDKKKHASAQHPAADRTISLIDKFLGELPEDKGSTDADGKRKPTPADASVDYVAWLMQNTTDDDTAEQPVAPMEGQELIDNFINNAAAGRIELKDTPEYVPETNASGTAETNDTQPFYTETLANVYIKQRRYDKALEIIKSLNLNYPKKNIYFADQIRFLEKLIINDKKNN